MSEKPCYGCSGTGTVTDARSEPDYPMGLALGAATGIGYMPMYKTVTDRKQCPRCGGRGRV